MKAAIHNYAVVLHSLSVDADEIKNANQIFSENPVLLTALDDPRVKFGEKEKTISRIFNGVMASFLKVVCKNGNISHIAEIFSEYEHICSLADGSIEATIFCVQPPNDMQLTKIKAFLCKKYSAPNVKISIIQDNSLLGGFIIRCGDIEFDRSLKGKLNKLQQKLIGEVK